MGRPSHPMPPRIEATPEQLAQAMFRLPADHQWEYLKDGPKEYRCVDCERPVKYPEVLYDDGRCQGCHAQGTSPGTRRHRELLRGAREPMSVSFSHPVQAV